MLTDKLFWAIDAFHAAMTHDLQNSLKHLNPEDEGFDQKRLEYEIQLEAMDKCVGIIKEELTFLEKTIESPKNEQLKSIDEKLDNVLMGPDYPEGKKLMNKAKDDFDLLSSKD